MAVATLNFKVIFEEIARTLRRPQRAVRLFRSSERERYLHARRERRFMDSFAPASTWDGDETVPFRRRRYSTYDEYLRQQRSKLTMMEEWVVTEYDETFQAAHTRRLRTLDVVQPGRNVLCLAARIGSEVRAFHELGCFAVGIDVNPGNGSRYVLEGDFHDLQFPTGSCDIVFTNSLDHAFDLDRLLAEVARVLKPDGAFVVEADDRPEKGPGPWESMSWRSVDDLVANLEARSWAVSSRSSFSDYPWPGTRLVASPRQSGELA